MKKQNLAQAGLVVFEGDDVMDDALLLSRRWLCCGP